MIDKELEILKLADSMLREAIEKLEKEENPGGVKLKYAASMIIEVASKLRKDE